MQDAEPRPARHFNICDDATRQHRTNIRASDLERLAFSCKRGKRCICSDRPDPVLRSLATPLYPNGLGGHRSDGVRTALSSGARIGALIGVLAVVNNSVEVFSGLRAPVLASNPWREHLGVMVFAFGYRHRCQFRDI